MNKVVFHHLSLVFLTLFSLASSYAQVTDITSKPEQITIYHNGALVQRQAMARLASGTHEIRLKSISSKIVLNSLKVMDNDITILQKEIIRKLSEEQFAQLIDTKYSLEAQLELLEAKYADTSIIKDVADLERMMQVYGTRITQIRRDLRRTEREIEAAKKLEAIVMENKDAAILKLHISTAKPLPNGFAFQYVVGGIGWAPSYEISVASSSETSVQMKYLAKVMNQTGEDWQEVNLHLSSASPVGEPIVLPMPDNPWVLENQRAVLQNAGVQGVYNYQWGSTEDIEQLEGVAYQQVSVPSYLKPRILEGRFSIPSNGTVFTFPILTTDIDANFYYYGFPSLDPEVYLVAELRGWDGLGLVDGMADISFTGNSVGRSLIKWSEVQDVLVLPIGRDNSVYMLREEIADEKYFKETRTSKKRKTTLAYSFQLKNNNSFPITFKLMDQLPISQTKSADVEIVDLSNANYEDRSGQVDWSMELSPSESVERRLIYTIDLDAGYRYDRAGLRKRRFRAVSCPSF